MKSILEFFGKRKVKPPQRPMTMAEKAAEEERKRKQRKKNKFNVVTAEYNIREHKKKGEDILKQMGN